MDVPWRETHPSINHVGVLLALALGTLAVGTEGFMIAAILPAIPSSLAAGVAAAGQLVTAFTLVYAVSSPLLWRGLCRGRCDFVALHLVALQRHQRPFTMNKRSYL
jgi:hypothetical protein